MNKATLIGMVLMALAAFMPCTAVADSADDIGQLEQ